jgi:hypothetical protein
VNFLLPPLDKGRVGVGKKFTTPARIDIKLRIVAKLF